MPSMVSFHSPNASAYSLSGCCLRLSCCLGETPFLHPRKQLSVSFPLVCAVRVAGLESATSRFAGESRLGFPSAWLFVVIVG